MIVRKVRASAKPTRTPEPLRTALVVAKLSLEMAAKGAFTPRQRTLLRQHYKNLLLQKSLLTEPAQSDISESDLVD